MTQTTVLRGDIGCASGPNGAKILTIEVAPGIIFEIPLEAVNAREVAKALDPAAQIVKGVPGLPPMRGSI